MELSIQEALNLALKAHQEGKLEEAERVYRKILKINPDNPDANHLLGLIAHQTENYKEALSLVKRAIEINQNNAVYYGNLAMILDKLERQEESIDAFKKAIKINPDYQGAHLAHYNLSIFYKEKNKLKEALEHLNKAIEIKEDFAEAHWNRSLILLLQGKFKEGWSDYEYRFKKQNPTDSRKYQKPEWDGSPLVGKRILVISEQGYGDNIQFVRYLPLIKKQSAHIILECKDNLKALLEDSDSIDEFTEKENYSKIKFDFYIHLMSLPRVFNTDLNTIPNKTPYLKSNSELVSKFKENITSDKFKIGISWAGNPNQEEDKNRSARFEKFKILKEIPEIQLYSLQKGESSSQLDDPDITNLSPDINNFADTAAIIENLDLIISIDTSIAHLAGALGKPVWTLLSFIHDWRWLLNRNDSPWYPNMRLFRQKEKGNWDSLFQEVKIELKKLIDSRLLKSSKLVMDK
ncbi:MAG: tetratricopeptide repeat protein [Nanoarchaeota archaeon]|nr:tetratricopeptide repeat protein [Nanoarchaeota archaeon]MBU4086842.1 tetratricopeptide repeat protein [Nanoarchaeota archaeon]